MDVLVTGRRCTITDDFRDKVTDRISSIERFKDRVIRVEVQLSAEPRAKQPDQAVKAEIRGLFPAGIKLTPPKASRRGLWRADLMLEGGNVIFLDTHRRGNSGGSRAKTNEPPGDAEGSKFDQLSSGSGCKTRTCDPVVNSHLIYRLS